MTAEQLVKRLNIPLEMAKKTLLFTTQQAVINSDETTLTRKYCANDRMLQYHQILCDSFMDIIFTAKYAVFLRGFKSCQIFAT